MHFHFPLEIGVAILTPLQKGSEAYVPCFFLFDHVRGSGEDEK